MRRPILALLGLALLSPSAQAGPWPTGKGHVYAKISYEFLGADQLAQPDGTIFDIPHYLKEESGLYVAVGVSDRVTLIGNVPAWRSSDLEDFGRESGFGDLRLGAQVQIGRAGGWLFAGRGILQAPTGDETLGEGLLPTGSGVWEGEGIVSVGRSFAGGRGYGFAEAGYQARGGGLTDGLLYGAQIGWNAGDHLVLAANLRGVEPWSHEPGEGFGSPVGFGDRVTYVYYGPTAIVKLDGNWAVQLDADFVFHAKNLATGTTLRGGIAFSK